jgi:hypothetical protein
MKRWLAASLCACLLLLCGCAAGSLEGTPSGARPSAIDGAELYPDFPQRAAVALEFNERLERIENAKTAEEMQAAYDELLHIAFVYVMGPYNLANFYASAGVSIEMYSEDMNNLMSDFLTNYEQKAWSAVLASPVGGDLLRRQSGGSVTPERVRAAHPSGSAEGQELTRQLYDGRDRYLALLDRGAGEEELLAELNSQLRLRGDLARAMGCAGFIDYCLTKRDSVPYSAGDLLSLAALAREELLPAYLAPAVGGEFSPRFEGAETLDADGWKGALPSLFARFPALENDLNYCLQNGLLQLEPLPEGGSARSFSYALYQYDLSIGKAYLAGDSGDLLNLFRLLGAMGRDMALPEAQWSVGQAKMADAAQQLSFAALCGAEMDALFGGEEAPRAKAELHALLLGHALCGAQRYALLTALYGKGEDWNAEELRALCEELSAQYGLPLSLEELFALDDVRLGLADSAGELLGSLTALQLGLLAESRPEEAKAVLQGMFTVYNYASPIGEAVKAGLPNPFSREAVRAAAQG